MQRISTPTSVANKFVGSNQTTGQQATNFSSDWCNSQQEELAHIIEYFGGTLDAGDDFQAAKTIEGLIQRRDLNFNGNFLYTKPWGGIIGAIPTPIQAGTKTVVNGLFLSPQSTISATDLVIDTYQGSLRIRGTAQGGGQTIELYQAYNQFSTQYYSTTPLLPAGETKRFTTSIEYKKAAASVDFTIDTFIQSLQGTATIVKNVQGDSSAESVGQAYRQISVNTAAIGSLPITTQTVLISLQSAGAFEIYIDNMNWFEGNSTPPLQVYGNDMVDNLFSEEIKKAYYQSGVIDGIFTVHKPTGENAVCRIQLPIENSVLYSGRNIKATDNVSIAIQGTPTLWRANDTDTITITSTTINKILDETKDIVTIEFVFGALEANPANEIQLQFSWVWSK